MRSVKKILPILLIIICAGCSDPNRDDWTMYHYQEGVKFYFSHETVTERFLYSAWNDGAIAWVTTPKRVWEMVDFGSVDSKLKTQYVITRWALDCFSDRMRPIELFKYKKGRWISQTVHDGDWRMRDTSVFSEKLFLKRCG